MNANEFKSLLEEVSSKSGEVTEALDRRVPAVSTQASIVLAIDEASAALAAMKRKVQSMMIESLEGQRGEHRLRGGLVAEVTMRSSKRKFDDFKTLRQLRDHFVTDADGVVDYTTAGVLDAYNEAIARSAYVGYWRTKALVDFGVDPDDVSTVEPGVPAVSVRREG